MDLTVASQGGSNPMLRDYRKGNWTLQETMILIEAKKMDDQRRMKRLEDATERGKPAELRWKWVEDYCWKHGCLRSQNQCNDKWDNLMRDFKKVREYERRVAERGAGSEDKSYWRIDKTERKDNNLPSNMLPQLYEALVEAVDRKGHLAASGSGGAGTSIAVPTTTAALVHHLPSPPPQMQHPYPISVHVPPMLPPPPPPPPPPPDPSSVPSSQPLPRSDSETSEYTDSPAKRRKTAGVSGSGGGGDVSSAISQSASIIAEAIRLRDDREEMRHRELLSVHHRRLQIEESKAEIERQGVNGLVDAINKLANSIVLAFAENRNRDSPSK